MKNLFYFFSVVMVLASCTDTSLDPLQFDQIKKGSILALRGTSLDNLSDENYQNGVDLFNLLDDNSNKKFEFTCDFLSENFSDLASVDVFAVNGAVRTKLLTVPASEFKDAAGTSFKRATISVPFSGLFAAAGGDICSFKPSDPATGASSFFTIENDINLADGSKVPASVVVNSSLFESTQFYPAHSLRFVAKGPLGTSIKDTVATNSALSVDLSTLMDQKDAVKEYKWVSDDNVNVSGEVASGLATKANPILNGGTLKNETTKKQTVVYTVTPVLSNGCDGLAFTISTLVTP